MFDMVDTVFSCGRAYVRLLISSGIFQGKQKIICMKSEMQILVGQILKDVTVYRHNRTRPK